MEFTKAIVTKQIKNEDGDVHEVIDVKIQVEIEDGDTFEDIRMRLQQRLEQRFNHLFRRELGLMKERIAEGQRWEQMGLFD